MHSIDLKSEHLARMLYPGKSGEGQTMMLAYAIRETIRNCFEHGGVESCIVTAQRLNNGQAEIAIADEGIGIQNSLARSGCHYSADEAIEAIRCVKAFGARTTRNKWDRDIKRFTEISIIWFSSDF